jgi:hypothetical protein
VFGRSHWAGIRDDFLALTVVNPLTINPFKMLLYTFDDLIRFLISSLENQHKNLNEIIFYAMHADLPAERKKMTLITALHACNLYEISPGDANKFIPDSDTEQLSETEKLQFAQNRYLPVTLQLFPCEKVIDNGVARFDIVMN